MTLNKILQLTVGMERCVWSQIRIQSAYSTTNVLNGPKAPGGKGGKAGQSVGKCRRVRVTLKILVIESTEILS